MLTAFFLFSFLDNNMVFYTFNTVPRLTAVKYLYTNQKDSVRLDTTASVEKEI